MTSLSLLKRTCLVLLLGITLSGCDNKAELNGTEATQEIAILNSSNVAKFKRVFIHDYIGHRNDLLAQFKIFKKENNAFGFTKYRNYKWTPGYIEKKDYYQAVFDKNKSYIKKASLKPLFDTYSNLLFIGVDLKNALLDNDDDLLKKAYAEIKADHATIEKYQSTK